MNDALVPRRTSPFLSKYECSRVIGLRLLQLQEGEGTPNPQQLAISEILERRNPTVIRRYLPDKTFEDVAVSSLRHDRFLLHYQLNLDPE